VSDDPLEFKYTTERIEPSSSSSSNDTAPQPNAGGNGGANANPSAGGTANIPGYTPPPWPELDPAALYGLAGEVVACLSPNTESDPVALLLSFLTSFGNAVGRGPYYEVENTRHFANLFVLLAGATAKARKGTSAERTRAIFEIADPSWAIERIQGGMSSGEGIISAVRDAQFVARKGVLEMNDPGVDDKRLLLYEPEFSSVLVVLNREGNILSRIVRDAWDCRPKLTTLTKQKFEATEPYISIIAHITVSELQRKLDETAMANGFANRFLFGCVKRARLLPHGGDVDPREQLGRRTLDALTAARAKSQLKMSEAARERWSAEYPALTASGDRLLDHITARAEAQVIRLALLYALLGQAQKIGVEHLEPALAVWRFCQASARYIFGEMVGDTVADNILTNLRAAGAAGMSKTDLINQFGRHVTANKITIALLNLLAAGKVRRTIQPGPFGRAREMWFTN
jgi:hypothetical protein